MRYYQPVYVMNQDDFQYFGRNIYKTREEAELYLSEVETIIERPLYERYVRDLFVDNCDEGWL